MKSVTRPASPARFAPFLSRSLIIAAFAGLVLFAPQGGPAANSAADSSGRPDQGAVAGFRPETRLRKLHLVRPDLIPYPIAYEVYC